MSKRHRKNKLHKNKRHRRKPRKGQFSLWDTFWLVGALLLVAYGAHGVAVNDLSLPVRYSPENFHVHGLAAWLIFGTLICAAIGMLRNMDSVANKHTSKEENQRFSKLLSFVGWSLFVAGAVVQIFFSNPH